MITEQRVKELIDEKINFSLEDIGNKISNYTTSEKISSLIKFKSDKLNTSVDRLVGEEPIKNKFIFKNQILKENIKSFNNIRNYYTIVNINNKKYITRFRVVNILEEESSKIIDDVHNNSNYLDNTPISADFNSQGLLNKLPKTAFCFYKYWQNKLTGLQSLAPTGDDFFSSPTVGSGTTPRFNNIISGILTLNTEGKADPDKIYTNILNNNTTSYYTKLLDYQPIEIIDNTIVDNYISINGNLNQIANNVILDNLIPLKDKTIDIVLGVSTFSTWSANPNVNNINNASYTDNIAFYNPLLVKGLNETYGYLPKGFGGGYCIKTAKGFQEINDFSTQSTNVKDSPFVYSSIDGFLLCYGIKDILADYTTNLFLPISISLPPIISCCRYIGDTFDNVNIFNENVGINISNPNYNLDVNGDINFTGTLFQNGAAFVTSRWELSGNDIFRLNTKVGINKSPLYNLDVSGDINFTGTLFQNGAAFVTSRWELSGNDIFRLNTKVGIGKNNPSDTLDVSGNVRAIAFNEGGTLLSSKYADVDHIHAISDITNLSTELNSKLNLTGGELTNTLTITKKADGAELLKLNIDMAWSFKQRSTGANAGLDLQSEVGNKYFRIVGSRGNIMTELYAHETPANSGITTINTAGNISASQFTENGTTLSNKYAPISHTHTTSQIIGLDTSLNSLQTHINTKADVNHTHTIANISGLQTALDGKMPTTHIPRMFDLRQLKPSDLINTRMQFGFGSFNNNNSSPYADILHLSAWSDGSGGNKNALMIAKNAPRIRLYQSDAFDQSSNYITYSDVVMADMSGNVDITGNLTVSGVSSLGVRAEVLYNSGVAGDRLSIGTGTDKMAIHQNGHSMELTTTNNGHISILPNGTGQINATATTRIGRIGYLNLDNRGSFVSSLIAHRYDYSGNNTLNHFGSTSNTYDSPCAIMMGYFDSFQVGTNEPARTGIGFITGNIGDVDVRPQDQMKMYISNTGNVGIGKTNPSERLDVDGTAKATAFNENGTLLSAKYAPISHTHTIANITGLQTALDGKAPSSHTHTIANITGLQTALDGKAPSSHTHTIANITGLQTALDGKAPSSHTHTIANITGLQTALDGKLSIVDGTLSLGGDTFPQLRISPEFGNVNSTTLGIQFGGEYPDTWNTASSGITEGPLGVNHIRIFASAAHPTEPKVYFGGRFEVAGGGGVANVAVFNIDTNTWSAVGAGLDGRVMALIFDQNGNLYAGGDFPNFVRRWDGTNWVAVGSGFNNRVYALAVGPDNGLYAAGRFTTPQVALAKWNGSSWAQVAGFESLLNGSTGVVQFPVADWKAAGDTAGGSTPYLPRAVGVTSTGAVYIGASSSSQFFYNGIVWNQWGTGAGVEGFVHTLTVANNNDVFIGGSFFGVNDNNVRRTVNNIARWNGSRFFPLGTGLFNNTSASGVVDSMVHDATGNLIVGGTFSHAGSSSAGGVRLSINTFQSAVGLWDGSSWRAIAGGTDSLGINGNSEGIFRPGEFGTFDEVMGVRAIAVKGQSVYVGGGISRTFENFSQGGELPVNRIAVFSKGGDTSKTAILCNPIGSFGRADLHFCLNNESNNDNATLNNSVLTILNNRNVGIGTNNPERKLVIHQAGTTGTARTEMAITHRMTGTSNGSGFLISTFADSSNNTNNRTEFYTNNTGLNGATAGWSSPALTIRNSTGNVGIGTNDPIQKLVVNGNIALGHRWDGATTTAVNLGKTDAGGNWGGGSAYISFQDGIQSGYGQGTNIVFHTHHFGVNTAERMRILGNGALILTPDQQANNDTFQISRDFGGTGRVNFWIYARPSSTTSDNVLSLNFAWFSSAASIQILRGGGTDIDRMRIFVPGSYIDIYNSSTTFFEKSISVAGIENRAGSDRRIKKNIIDLSDNECLEIIRLLKPCKYNYIDKKRGTDVVYGFIAQEVKEVLPYAVETFKNYINLENVIHLNLVNIETTDISNEYILTSQNIKNIQDLSNITNIKITNTNRNFEYKCKILDNDSLNNTRYLLTNETAPFLYEDINNEWYISHIEIPDFHNLKKDPIWTVATSALQEVDRIQQRHQQEITQLTDEMNTLKSQYQSLLSRLEALENK
jgi:hypothetical protein